MGHQIDRDSELRKSFFSDIYSLAPIFKPCLLQNHKLDSALTWLEALGPHGDLELLESLHSDVQDGCQGSRLENLHTTSPPKLLVELSRNLVGGIRAA